MSISTEGRKNLLLILTVYVETKWFKSFCRSGIKRKKTLFLLKANTLSYLTDASVFELRLWIELTELTDNLPLRIYSPFLNYAPLVTITQRKGQVPISDTFTVILRTCSRIDSFL